MGPLSLPADGSVYIDSQVVIYEVEDRQPFRRLFDPLWQRMASGELVALTSELTWLEVMVHPLRRGDQALEAAFRNALTRSGLRVKPITLAVLSEAARLRALRPSLRTPDAIHVATALVTGCTMFLTNDQRIRDIPGLPVSYLSL